MPKEPTEPPQEAYREEPRAEEELSELGIAHRVIGDMTPSTDPGHTPPVHSDSTVETDHETLSSRCLRFVAQDVFSHIDKDSLAPDMSASAMSEGHGGLSATSVFYATKEDVTINIYTKLYIDALDDEWTNFALIAQTQTGLTTAQEYIRDLRESNPDAFHGFRVEIDFFRGKYCPLNPFEAGSRAYFAMNPGEAAYPDDGLPVEQLGHFDVSAEADGSSELFVYLGSEEHPNTAIGVSDIDTMAALLHDAEELRPLVQF